MRPPSFGVGSTSDTYDVDSLKVRKKLPVLDVGTSRLESLSPSKIRKIFEHWVTEMALKIST
eukprot:12471298-Prorocentrum_lima.AAC.1